TGSVSHTSAAKGRAGFDRRARAVRRGPAPTLAEAIVKSPVPVGPPVWAKPSLVGVRPTAIMSGAGSAPDGKPRGITPAVGSTASRWAQKRSSTGSVGAGGLVGVKGMRKLWKAPAAIEMRVWGEPVSALVWGSVVWNRKVPGTVVTGTMPQPVTAGPVL